MANVSGWVGWGYQRKDYPMANFDDEGEFYGTTPTFISVKRVMLWNVNGTYGPLVESLYTAVTNSIPDLSQVRVVVNMYSDQPRNSDVASLKEIDVCGALNVDHQHKIDLLGGYKSTFERFYVDSHDIMYDIILRIDDISGSDNQSRFWININIEPNK